jgi:hypothetical protein
VINLLFKLILEKLMEHKIGIFIRNFGQSSYIEGILKEISEDIITLETKYNDLVHLSTSEIIGVKEKKPRKKF